MAPSGWPGGTGAEAEKIGFVEFRGGEANTVRGILLANLLIDQVCPRFVTAFAKLDGVGQGIALAFHRGDI